MKKVLVTGANGFIGKNIAEHLNGNYEVLPISRNEADLLDVEQVGALFRKENIDVVIHSATQSTLGKGEVAEALRLENNLRMFFHLEKYSDYYGKLFILGSGAEYNKAQNLSLVSEEQFDKDLPFDNYGLSKYIMTRIADQKDNIYNLRLFGIFGAHENYNYRFISNVICKALEHRDIVIRQNALFDYLYVKDFCKMLPLFIEKELRYKSYNVCTGQRQDIVTLAKNVVELTDSRSKIEIVKDGMNFEYTGSNQRLNEEFGELIFTPMEQALRELIKFYKMTPYQLEGDY